MTISDKKNLVKMKRMMIADGSFVRMMEIFTPGRRDALLAAIHSVGFNKAMDLVESILEAKLQAKGVVIPA